MEIGVFALIGHVQSALQVLNLGHNSLGDEGLAALVAPPPPAGALPPPTGVLTKLKELDLDGCCLTDAGCAALIAALDSGAMPALARLHTSAAAQAAVQEALAKRFKL